ncbi:hypothetical protein MKX01_012554 [Papaver californicum]|nr:hypothetical protein MKX01_012554 [Papaver californicum]
MEASSDSGCIQAKVYLKRELFLSYDYKAEGRPRFEVGLGLFVDCLNTFSLPGHSNAIEIQYPGSDLQLLFKSIDSPDACIYAELRTRIPETISWDYNFEPAGSMSFTVKSAALKEAVDDLEWPGASIQITLVPEPPCVTFRGEGHGDLQIDFMYYANTDLLMNMRQKYLYGRESEGGRLGIFCFTVRSEVVFSFPANRYKYKFLKATTSTIPTSVIRENRGSKLTIGRGGMLKVQHLVSVSRSSI